MLDRSGFECLTDQVSNCLIFELLNCLNTAVGLIMLDRSGFECLTDQVSNCLIFELLNCLNSMRVFVFVNVKINHVKTVEYTILYLIENQ